LLAENHNGNRYCFENKEITIKTTQERTMLMLGQSNSNQDHARRNFFINLVVSLIGATIAAIVFLNS
jgi:hypothetical protein